MGMTRRKFIQGAAAAGAGIGLGAAGQAAGAPGESTTATPKNSRKRRTIYFNDARHYYLYVFEPPMRLEDAWVPIDEVAGTTVDTFSYGVARGDGLFYPSKIGLLFGDDKRPFEMAAYWRAWECMQSLIARGLDPLKVLIDRAHAKGMDFIASLRMAGHGGMNPKHRAPEGRGMAHQEVRDHQFKILNELVTDYEVEGVELDFAASPGGAPPILRPDDVKEYTPVLTEYVRGIAKMVRDRPGPTKEIGVRVYPTEVINLAQGLDVRTWLKEGLVDYVMPMLYIDFTLDTSIPIDWLIEASHEHDVAVYGMLQPYTASESATSRQRFHLTPETMRAGAANYWQRGVDGVCAWFLTWPLGDAEKRALTEIGDPDRLKESTKRYVVRRRSEQAVEMGYDAALPIKIEAADPAKRYSVPFYIADDIEASPDRLRHVRLKVHIANVVSADQLTVLLNGKSLAGEACRRRFSWHVAPYQGQILEFELEKVRPRQGENTLEISLDQRPKRLAGGVTIEEVEVFVEYGIYPPGLEA